MAFEPSPAPQPPRRAPRGAAQARRRTPVWPLLLPLYGFTLLFVFLPILYMFYLSFTTRAEVWGFVNAFTLENYARITQPLYAATFFASLRLALLSTGILLLAGYPFGYMMARLSPAWKKRVMLLVMVPFWTSSLIRLNGWVIVLRANGILDKLAMGLGLTSAPLKLLYTYPAVVFGMVYELLPFMILAVYTSAEKMDWTLVEAARDLGASRWQAFWTVTLPMTMPGVLSGIILTFIPSMGLFYIADVLGGNKIVLVGSIIQEQLTKGRNLPFAAAMSVILMLLTSLLLALYRRLTKSGEVEGIL